MDRRRVKYLATTAGVLVLLIGLLHLAHESAGFPRLIEQLQTSNLLLDPRPALFSLLGVASIAGVLLVWNGMLPRQSAYLAGIGLMLVLLFGYALWHLTGHGGFWPWRPAHFHDTSPLDLLWNHFWSYPWAQASKTLELIALVLLAYIYRHDYSD